ncbi:phosphorylcholine transferase LicD [Ruminococcus sp.]|uniref:LicD family protein n=1 Tax=Ruminococcus sp. TaxID=41978 RepID=UPI00388F4CFC
MTDSVIKNEIYLSAEYIKRRNLTQDEICIVGTHKVAAYLKATSDYLGAGASVFPSAAAVEGDFSHLWYVLDASDYDAADIETALSMCKKHAAQLTCIILLQNIKENRTIQKYAEMELIAVMSDTLGELRNLLSGHRNVRALFFDRIFSCEFDCFDLAGISREAQNNRSITITQSMANTYTSALYICDAIDAVYTVSKNGKDGNIYNASSFYLSEYQLRSLIYTMLARHGVTLNVMGETAEPVYAALSNGKLRSLGYENVCSLSDALRYSLLRHLERFSIQTDRIHDGYSGKLNTLRSLEKDMLREIDRICRKHEIKYFICYGTLLGAVRHGGFIPWDDDVDVAMLRPEFEKFRQIAPKELNIHFSYESHRNQNGYHFFFDRITAKNTYFASKYSDGYEMHKGISVDIFVLDAVPANPNAAYRFWKGLMRRRMLMNVRWKNTARRDKAYWLSKLLLPILRLRSMDSFSRSYEKAVRKYEKKQTGRVMPASSDHIYRGTFPAALFEEVIPYRFDDVDTFIPVGYKDFLKAWYTENYMEMLPLSEQNPFHDYYRLDLGGHILPQSDVHFDYMGELK